MADTIAGLAAGLFGGGGFGIASQAQQLTRNAEQIQQQFQQAQGQAATFGSGSGFTSNNLSWASDLANAQITIAPSDLTGVTSVAHGVPPPTEETALAWLDRRVGEMRVAL